MKGLTSLYPNKCPTLQGPAIYPAAVIGVSVALTAAGQLTTSTQQKQKITDCV